MNIITINDNVYIFYNKSLGTYIHSTTLLFCMYTLIFEDVKLNVYHADIDNIYYYLICSYNLYDASKLTCILCAYYFEGVKLLAITVYHADINTYYRLINIVELL